jgi:hypothetical protein
MVAALLPSPVFARPAEPMLETNPILAQITDLKTRVGALRGFL